MKQHPIPKRLSAFLLCFALLVGLLPIAAFAATNVQYIDADGTTKTCASATEVTSSSEAVTWNAGWYVVNSNVTISSRVTVSGEVNLILADRATLTASAGITVSQGNSLTIYAQSTGNSKGQLIAGVSGTIADNYAGIGGVWNVSSPGTPGTSGTITINGGTVTATGGLYGAGIGGGNSLTSSNTGGTVNINSGTVTATGGGNGAGIGGGNNGSGTVNINGGTVLAQGGYSGAGIGNGMGGTGGNIIITDGTVTAIGGNFDTAGGTAGIGGGTIGTVGSITITGGTVIATGQGAGAGIGRGYASSGTTGNCSITGDAVVIATGGANANGEHISATGSSSSWDGIVFQGNDGQVYGNVTLEDDLTIPNGATLTVPSGTTLTIPEGVTVEGSITNNGTINNSGTLPDNVGGTVNVPATVSVTVNPTTATYGSTVTLTASVANATDGMVTFYLGTASGTSLGSVNVSSGTATLNNVEITSTNGFTTDSNTITAVYSGGTGLLGNSGTATLTVSRKSVTASLAGTTTKVYDGTISAPSGLTIKLAGVITGDDVEAKATSITYDNADVGTNKTITATEISLVGTHAAYYTLSNETATTTGSITAAAASVDTAPAAVNLTYTGQAQALVTAGTASNGTMVYALGTDAATTPTDNYNNTIPTGTNAGTYYVWYKVQANQNYSDTDPQCVTVTVAKKELTVSAVTANGKTYDGTTTATGTITLTGAVNSEQPTVTGDFAFEDANAGANKQVSVTGIALEDNWGTNYALTTTSTTATATISPLTATLVWSGYENLIYTGNHVNVTATVGNLVMGDTCTVTVTGGTETNAGQYTATATDLSNSNYALPTEGTTQPYSIGKASQDAPGAPTLASRTTSSITLNEMAPNVNEATVEYGISRDNGETWTWQNSPTFTGLSSGTTYTFAARYQETSTHKVSEPSTPVAFQTTVYIPPQPTGPSTGGSKGWEDIQQELADAQDGETVTIDMNGETEVPGEVWETIAGRDVTVILDMGENVSWTVDGNNVPTGTIFGNMDFGVDLGTTGIDVDVINAVTGEVSSVQITLAHDGAFGFTLTLTAPLGAENAGYWANLYHYDEDAETLNYETSGEIKEDGTAALRITHASQYAIIIDKQTHQLPFTDVTSGAWYEQAVRYAYLNSIMAGTSGTAFQPNGTLSRAMAVQILYNLEGQPDISDENLGYPYSDVDASQWYGNAVYWARITGVAEGDGDGTFRPTDSVTRQEFAQMLYNYASYKGYDLTASGDLSTFPDSGKIADWAGSAMSWANGEGLINGHDNGLIDPTGTATRAQAASILIRFDQKLAES